MKHLKPINEENNIKVMNKSHSDKINNLSADANIAISNGKKPYRKVYRRMVAIEDRKTIPSNGTYWLSDEQRDMINNLGEAIEGLVNKYDSLLDSLKKHWNTPDWEEKRDAFRASKDNESLERDENENGED